MAIENHSPGSRIAVPAAYTVTLCLRPPQTFVVAAPASVEASPEGIVTPGIVAGLFTHAGGLTWPDRAGVTAANSYLEAGCPIALVFEDLGSALTCHARLIRGQAT